MLLNDRVINFDPLTYSTLLLVVECSQLTYNILRAVHIFQKGDPLEIDNDRPIFVNSIVTILLKKQLSKYFETKNI